MLGYIGYYASVSLVSVPNIVNRTTTEATSDLSLVGLILGSSTGTTASGATTSNYGKVATQNPAANSTVNPGSSVSYTTYACTPSTGSWYNVGSTYSSSCDGSYIYTYQDQQRTITYANCTTGTESRTVTVGSTSCAPPPPPSCPPGSACTADLGNCGYCGAGVTCYKAGTCKADGVTCQPGSGAYIC